MKDSKSYSVKNTTEFTVTITDASHFDVDKCGFCKKYVVCMPVAVEHEGLLPLLAKMCTDCYGQFLAHEMGIIVIDNIFYSARKL